MTTLHELSKQMIEVQELAKDPDMDPRALVDTLDGIEGLIQDKGHRIVAVIANSAADIKMIDDEIARLQARKKIYQNAEKRLKDYLRDNMEATGITKIEHPTLPNITLRKGVEVAIIDEEDDLPDDYVQVQVVSKPDKKKILAALKEDRDSVPGAHIERNPPTVTIK